jgi:hypothetical protein
MDKKQKEALIVALAEKGETYRDFTKKGGVSGMESRLINIVANCKLCGQSKNWLGRNSSISKINSGKLWLSQHLSSIGMTDSDKRYLLEEVTRAKN